MRRLERYAIWALFTLGFCGCASGAPVRVPVPPPTAACLPGAEGETEGHLLARILVDACTAQQTDEVLIEHALLLLNACHMGATACVRKVCVRLYDADRDDPLLKVWRPR